MNTGRLYTLPLKCAYFIVTKKKGESTLSDIVHQIENWAEQAEEWIRSIKDSSSEKHWPLNMEPWLVAFGQLKTESSSLRQQSDQSNDSGTVLNQLLFRAQQLYLSFNKYLRFHSLYLNDDVRLIKPSIFKKNQTALPSGPGSQVQAAAVEYDPVPIGQHTLPPLPYDYDALEPYIDEQTMRLHHDKHHKGYVEGLNRAEEMMQKARNSRDFDLIKHWEREAAFNGGGHYLHTIFWNIMSPHGGGEPEGLLRQQIDKDFGSFKKFKEHFSAAAEKVEGVGWAILVWAPRAQRLEILQSEKHQNLTQWDVVPLLVLDVWEHAYYLKYQNKRSDYIDAWWNVVYWPHVNERFETARRVIWKPY